MSNPKSIVIDGTEYLPAASVRPPHDSTVRIVVLQRGWVVVGYYAEDDDRVLLSNTSVIQTWGTTKGLGELVDGPTSATRLAPCGSVEAHRLGVVLTIAADASKWESHLCPV